MVRIFGSMMLGAALAQAQVQAQDERIEQGPVPDWAIPSELMPVPKGAGGLIFVRRQAALIHLDAEGQAQYFGRSEERREGKACVCTCRHRGWQDTSKKKIKGTVVTCEYVGKRKHIKYLSN